ncbi:hypothetical protein [Rhodoblastus acidophilus]|uniref:hypothetical protein n=1 Tax=Rhodoblastus acidophilus TaxID=1074 RepID=UPI002225B286|nr:hypothetical protein [Rhodoblastus acidophilus]MCW2284191.1 hypothetical protein [Rhodoblastus acidophilus]
MSISNANDRSSVLSSSDPAVLALLTEGCANAPQGSAPAVQIAREHRVEMLVTTTRCPSDVPGDIYSGERGTAIDFDLAAVATPASSDPRENVSPDAQSREPLQQKGICSCGCAPRIDWFAKTQRLNFHALGVGQNASIHPKLVSEPAPRRIFFPRARSQLLHARFPDKRGSSLVGIGH